jgi:hypothetical protein
MMPEAEGDACTRHASQRKLAEGLSRWLRVDVPLPRCAGGEIIDFYKSFFFS